jgi:hypothetical protein
MVGWQITLIALGAALVAATAAGCVRIKTRGAVLAGQRSVVSRLRALAWRVYG